MVFNSLQYAAFLPIVLFLYWRLRRRPQNLLLLVASYFFYAMWDWRFLGLMAFTTLVDFTVGKALERTPDDRRRKAVFFVSVAVNLSVLGFFKYFNFFVGSAIDLLERFGLRPTEPTLKILLPVGISFFTFHGISYTFDVYRRHIRASDDLVDFAVFVAFFPQLVAGPIGRAQLQLPQFQHDRARPDKAHVASALLLISMGLLRKVVIADGLAGYVNATFGSAGQASWISLLAGMYAFALQIYGDFAGYTDIARGSARLFGIELPHNFRQPYLARNITEFWRLWHISLSNWLRDYLYVPLGGNRKGKVATYRNLMLTMLLGGLWHGASWTFVVWGGLHGAYLCAHRWWIATRPKDAEPSRIGGIVAAVLTFHAVCAAWIFFRAQSLPDAARYVKGILTFRSGDVNLDLLAMLVPAALASFALDVLQRRTNAVSVSMEWPSWQVGAAVATVVIPILVFSGGAPVPFIYFQF